MRTRLLPLLALALLAALAWRVLGSNEPPALPALPPRAAPPPHASRPAAAQDPGAARSAPEAPPVSERVALDENLRHVRGRVLFAPDTPADDAPSIAARRFQLEFETGSAGPVPVAADGRFDLRVPKRGSLPWTLYLAARWSHLPYPVNARESDRDEDLGDLQAELGARIEGRVVLPEGCAPPTAPIELELGHAPLPQGRTPKSDLDSRALELGSELGFAFDAIPVGTPLWLVARAAGFRPLSQAVPQLRPGETTRVELALARGASVSGVVVDRRGQPVRRAYVRLLRPRTHASALLVPDLSDGEGRFALDGLAAGSCDLLASHAEHPATLVHVEALGPEEQRGGLRIELRDFLALEGALVDEHGAGVPYASVLLLDLDQRDAPVADLSRSYGSVEQLDGGEEVGSEERWSNSVSGLRANGDGRFRAEKLTAGRVLVLASQGALVGRADAPVELGEGKTASVRIELRAGACAFVLVQDDPHPALPDARIAVLDATGVDYARKPFSVPFAMRQKARESQPGLRGVAAGPLPPGSYRARATRKDGATAEALFTVAGSDPVQVELEFQDGPR